MKVWNPSSKSFEATPPLPEFVGHWQTYEGRQGKEASPLTRLARVVLRRLRAAMDAFLGLDEAGPPTQGIVSEMAPTRCSDRVVLPMSSGVNVLPGDQALITGSPQNVAFRPERIVIGGHPDRWIVNEIKIGRHSQLANGGDLPGAAFAAGAQDAGVCLDIVQTGVNVSMYVTYIGPEPRGERFTCTAIGLTGLDLPLSSGSDETATSRIYLPLSSGVHILPGTSAQICVNPQDPFRPERIIIGGDPDAWMVNDIKVGDRSQLLQRGDIPGGAFAATARDTFVSFETVQTAMRFSLLVTYVGTKEEGEPLFACAIGTVPA